LQMGSNQGSPGPVPGPQYRPPHTGPSMTTFSPAAREFVPSGMAPRGSATSTGDGQQAAGVQQPHGGQGGYP
jgi:hypothetical protein